MTSRRSASSALSFALLLTTLVLPSRAFAGGAWTTGEGFLWAKLSLVYQRSDQQLADRVSALMTGCGTPIGRAERMPFDCVTGGTFEVTATYLDLMFGVVDGVDLRLQLPVIVGQAFWNDSGLMASQDVALGDVRLGGQVRVFDEPELFLAALRWELKAPTGFFTTDEGQQAVGQGQWDFSGWLAISRGLALGGGASAWLNAELGWRVRFTNPATGINVGDELLGLLEGGVRFDWFMLPVKLELIYGLDSTVPSEPTPRPQRWIFSALISGIFAFEELSPIALELGVRVPLVGEGYPSIPVFSFGIWGEVDLYAIGS